MEEVSVNKNPCWGGCTGVSMKPCVGGTLICVPGIFNGWATYYLYRRLRKILPALGGRVLDVGCGMKPYQGWFGVVQEYVGLRDQ